MNATSMQPPTGANGTPIIQNTVIVNGKPAPAQKGCVRRAFGCTMWILAAVAAAGIIAGIAGAGKKKPAPSADAPAGDATAAVDDAAEP